MDLYWSEFRAEPEGPLALAVTVTPGGMLGVSGSIRSTAQNFSSDVGVSCLLDGGAGGAFSFDVTLVDGLGTFFHEVPVGQLDVTPGNTYWLEAVLDPDDRWPEFVEGLENISSNVGYAWWVEIVPPPPGTVDLGWDFWSTGFSPSLVEVGEPVSVSFDVTNLGTEPSGAFEVTFYASSNSVISNSDIELGTVTMPSIVGGGSASCALSSASTAGLVPNSSYYMGWILDSGDAIIESDESNNIGYIASELLVSAPVGSTYDVTSFPIAGYDPLSANREVLFDAANGTAAGPSAFASIPSPFPIQFFGASVSELHIATTGYVLFGGPWGSAWPNNYPIPHPSSIDGYAAVFWDDLFVGTNWYAPGGFGISSEISYEVVGSFPDRTLKIEFFELTNSIAGVFLYGQLWIREQPPGVNSILELRYPPTNYGNWWEFQSATIGIESPSGLFGYEGPPGSPNISVKPTVNYRFQ